MDFNNISKDENEKIKIIKSNINLGNIKSDYFLQKIYDIMNKKKSLELVKYNKKLKNRVNLSLKDYKKYSETFSSIEIEIIPKRNKYGKFISINKNEKSYYHIYFNDNKEETKNKFNIDEKDKIKRINIKIDYQVKLFENLFKSCRCIESINFKKFSRNNITIMSYMFHGCSLLKELILSNFNTNNVKNMSYMFYRCSSLKELNLSNFNTNNDINMSCMFDGCSNDLREEIRNKYKNIKEEAFEE